MTRRNYEPSLYPSGPRRPGDSPYTGALAVDPAGPVRIVLANGFPDSVPFLEAVGRALEAAFRRCDPAMGQRCASIRPMPWCRRSARRATGSSRLTGTEAAAPPAPCVTALQWLSRGFQRWLWSPRFLSPRGAS